MLDSLFWIYVIGVIVALAISIPLSVYFAGIAIRWMLAVQRRYETRHLVDAVLEGDSHRPFCLFLRSFEATGIGRGADKLGPMIFLELRERYERESARWGKAEAKRRFLEAWDQRAQSSQPFELTLAKALEPELQLVALGRQRDFRGVGVFSTEDDDWERTAQRLMRRASLLIVMPGETSGLASEIRWIARDELLDAVLFVLPGHGSRNLPVEAIWVGAARTFEAQGWELPEECDEGCWFRLDSKGRLIESRAFDPDLRAVAAQCNLVLAERGLPFRARPEPVSVTFEPLPGPLRLLATFRAWLE